MRRVVLLALAVVLPASAGPERLHPLGRSLEGRLISAVELGDPASERKALVVGCIHGDECAGIAILRRLQRLGPLEGVDLWLVPDANPDGHAAGVRWNAHHVDLNRNFPWRWRRQGGLFDSGPAPGSERETRIAMRLILRLRPQVTIWFHQHLNMVVLTSGDLALQRRFARLAGLRVGRLPRYPGTATGWQNARLPGTTAFVVELPADRLSARAVTRYARAVRSVVARG
jgi:murein peptide amidase A